MGRESFAGALATGTAYHETLPLVKICLAWSRVWLYHEDVPKLTDAEHHQPPEFRPFHVRCEVTLRAGCRSEALSMAAIALENWNDETGWKHIDGIGDPAGFVLVTEQQP